MDESDGLRVHEVALLMGWKSVDYVYSQIKRKGFPKTAYKVGRERLWSLREVQQWREDSMRQQSCPRHGIKYHGHASCPLCQWDEQRRAAFPEHYGVKKEAAA